MDLSERVVSARIEGSIGGLAVALVKDGELIQRFCGFADADENVPVTEETVFEAASLGKPVFAYAVLKLVDQGVLSLDAPLAALVDYAPGDAFAAEITAAHVLSHTTGFPNWRSSELPLRCYFRPGERFSYSGEGFVLLQRAVERLTGESIELTARRLVFEPLGMNRSTFDQTKTFDGAVKPAQAPNASGRPHATCNVAHSLRTTAHDYARFLQAALGGTGLKSTTSKAWVEARTSVAANFINCADPTSRHQTDAAVGWGLGWGLEMERQCFFQWGAKDGYVSFAIGSRPDGVAFVMLTTGFTGLECLRQLVEIALPGRRPSLAWIGRRTDLPE
jgi:CubicO group peptidase (beta-lactamase class C family)